MKTHKLMIFCRFYTLISAAKQRILNFKPGKRIFIYNYTQSWALFVIFRIIFYLDDYLNKILFGIRIIRYLHYSLLTLFVIHIIGYYSLFVL
jgi:hypothetical protein